MNTMAKIAIGTTAVIAICSAAAFFMLDAPQGMANAGNTIASRQNTLRSAAPDASSRFEVAQATVQPAANQSAPLPGGASTLQESYQDWMVVCATQPGADGQLPLKRCAMSQQQASQQGGQRVLAIELKPAGAVFEASLFLPFGLALDKGVMMQIDDGQLSSPFRFRTCLPAGCIVPMTFDVAYTTALQKGTSLRIKTVSDGGTDAPFAISLKGFGAAAARLTALAK